jgi:hypothetical protein
MHLFTHALENRMRSEAPLAARMRPRTLDDFVGQQANAVGRYPSASASSAAEPSRPTASSPSNRYLITIIL